MANTQQGCDDLVLTGSIAIIKVKGEVIGKMKDVRYQEQIRRVRVGGIGTIFASEQAAVEWDGTLNCDFMVIDLNKSQVPGSIRRDFNSARSQVLSGKESYEDQLTLSCCVGSVQVDIFKKICDTVSADGKVIPKLQLIGTIPNCLIESDSFSLAESQISSRSQSFKCLTPIVIPSAIQK